MATLVDTPWGKASHHVRFAPGFTSVQTETGGGYILAEGLAKRSLSRPALVRARRWQSYFCYSEECLWAIPALELEEFWPVIFDGFGEEIRTDPRPYLVTFLSLHCADYLLERKIPPVHEMLVKWEERQQRDRMVKRGDPDLIIASKGVLPPPSKELAWVMTADKKLHLVTLDSLRSQDEDFRLLSQCRIVDPRECQATR